MASAAFAIQQMSRRLHEELDRGNVRRRWPSAANSPTGPHAFALHRHSSLHFELQHPADWKAIEDAAGTIIRPARLNAFVRVDVVPEGGRRWSPLEAWVRRSGGWTQILGERDAVVELGSSVFACLASTRHGRGVRLVLVSGVAVRPALSPRLRAYLAGVLRAIRRHLRAF